MTLEQLMAFTVTNDHSRQEQVWRRSPSPTTRSPIISASSSPRARCAPPTSGRSSSGSKPIRPQAASSCATCSSMTMAAGCRIRRCSTGLSPRTRARSRGAAREGWKWIAARSISLSGILRLRRLPGEIPPLTEDEQKSYDALRAEYDRLQETYGAADELPDEVDARLGEIETLLERFDERPAVYDPVAMAMPASSSASMPMAISVSSAASPSPRRARCGSKADQETGESVDRPAAPRTVITVGGTALRKRRSGGPRMRA